MAQPININSKRGVEDLDPFNRAPPGWSLTQPKGKWNWDKPPVHSGPAEAVDAIIDKLEEPEVEESMVKLMFSGISIQEIVNTIAIAGFSEGRFNPDVAEIIKAPIASYLLGVATDFNLPVKMFNSSDGLHPEDESLNDSVMLDIMEERNPDLYKFLMEQAESPEEEVEEPQVVPQGFLAIQMDEPMPEQVEEPIEQEREEIV
jgi:hypothetical protein